MKILFLSELFYPHGGGAELANYLYAKLLVNEDIEVDVVTNRFSGEDEITKDGKLTVYRLPLLKNDASAKYLISLRVNALLSDLIRRLIKSADVVYIPRFWFSAIPLVKAYGKPVICHLHDYIPRCPLAIVYNLSEKKICDRKNSLCSPKCVYSYEKIHGGSFGKVLSSTVLNCTIGNYFGKLAHFSDAIICVSKKQRELIVENSRSIAKKTYVVYNPLPEVSDIPLEGDDFGYFGGPNYLKGFNVLYRSMKDLKRKKKFNIFPYAKLDRNDFAEVYKKVRTVLLPSVWHEPWPYVVVEALLKGRFVIASEVGGIPEQVKGCKGVMLFPAGDQKELADDVQIVSNMKREQIADFGFQNREVFLKRRDTENACKKFTALLSSLN